MVKGPLPRTYSAVSPVFLLTITQTSRDRNKTPLDSSRLSLKVVKFMQSSSKDTGTSHTWIEATGVPHAGYPDALNDVFSNKVVARIASAHGLSAFSESLASTLKHAGGLYVRYSPAKTSFVHELAPKCRAVSRTAELARQLQTQLGELDFWDRWQIFKRLEETGHPIATSFDSYAQINPLLAGDMVMEEIQLILKAAARYEGDFFKALETQPEGGSDIGLFFFVQVIGAFWTSITGKKVLEQEGDISPEAHSFVNDCLEPLGTVEEEQITAAIVTAFK